jgi:hypothetical protein
MSDKNQNHGLCLVIADRGHVWVGETVTVDDLVIIAGARIVRRWGTQRGLNQLANEGPLPNTQLDDPALVKLNRRAMINIIPCKEEAWIK